MKGFEKDSEGEKGHRGRIEHNTGAIWVSVEAERGECR